MSGLLVARRGSLHRSAAVALDYVDTVNADSPVAWWRMEETAGSTVADEVGTNDGTVFGANLNVAGLGGTLSGASFDGVDDRISVPHASSLNIGFSYSTFTLECLVKLDTVTPLAVQMLVDKNDNNSFNNQYTLRWDGRTGNRTISYYMRSTGGFITIGWSGSGAETALLAGCHIAVTKTADTLRLYVDGVERDVLTGISFAISSSSQPLGIASQSGGGTYADGVIDEVAIYNTALSAARVLAHAQAGGFA